MSRSLQKDGGTAKWNGSVSFETVIGTLSEKFKEQGKIESMEEYVEDVLSREVNYPL